MNRALLPARFQQQSRARSPFKTPRKGVLILPGQGRGSQLQPFPGGSGSGAGSCQPPSHRQAQSAEGAFLRGNSRKFSLHSGAVRALPFSALP